MLGFQQSRWRSEAGQGRTPHRAAANFQRHSASADAGGLWGSGRDVARPLQSDKAMAAVLKVTYQSEFRRCRLEEADISYEGLCRWLSRLFPEVNCYCAKYVDDEGDRCTLCDASFSDFLELSSSPGGGQVELGKKMILRLELQPEEPKPEPVPKFKVVHEGITCDGCQAAPIMGDRFKCGSCPDYDLCDACYKKRPEVHGGDFANHDFHRVDRQSLCGIARTIWKQKRKESKKEHGQKERGPCPGAGCPYKVTWHRSHCCHSCSKGAGHGKKCERVRKEEDVIPPPVLPEDSEKMHQEAREGAKAAGAASLPHQHPCCELRAGDGSCGRGRLGSERRGPLPLGADADALRFPGGGGRRPDNADRVERGGQPAAGGAGVPYAQPHACGPGDGDCALHGARGAVD
ncbi:unnamed protein product [Effrenium voratum]|nr:unnamed protein product [Effrenium voratum]